MTAWRFSPSAPTGSTRPTPSIPRRGTARTTAPGGAGGCGARRGGGGRPRTTRPPRHPTTSRSRRTPDPAGEAVDPGSELLAVLGRELAARMAAVAKAGLVRAYREEDADSTFLRGRLRTAEQLRDAARGRTPDLFHITDTAFDLDTPWNR